MKTIDGIKSDLLLIPATSDRLCTLAVAVQDYFRLLVEFNSVANMKGTEKRSVALIAVAQAENNLRHAMGELGLLS